MSSTSVSGGEHKQGARAEDHDEHGGVCVSPTPSGEDLLEGEVDRIVTDTKDILQFCLNKVDAQNIDNHSLTFMVLRLKESIEKYEKDFLPMLNTFLVESDNITADYYARMCCNLPKYGDYLKAIEAHEGDEIAAGADNALDKRVLRNLVSSVADNYYTSAWSLRTGRSIYRDVNGMMRERKNLVCRFKTPAPNWMEIQNTLTFQLDSIRKRIIEVTTYLNFLEHGELKIGTAPSLKGLETHKPAKKREDKKIDEKEPEVKKPEVKKQEVKKPEVKKPEVKKPDVKKPPEEKKEVEKPKHESEEVGEVDVNEKDETTKIYPYLDEFDDRMILDEAPPKDEEKPPEPESKKEKPKEPEPEEESDDDDPFSVKNRIRKRN